LRSTALLTENTSQGETMEINGVAHIFLTASNFERSREFYRKLLPFLGLKPVIDTETTYYCVGGRTAVGISAPSAEHAGAAFEQKRVGLHHLCFRARERADIDELHSFLKIRTSSARRARINGRRAIIRFCSRTPTASGLRSIMCRGRGCWGELSSSWPGLSRPSTSCFSSAREVVDARVKPGQDVERVIPLSGKTQTSAPITAPITAPCRYGSHAA
jgi:hypothetical protein